HRSEAADVFARSLETADLIQCVDRGMVRSGDQVEAGVLGGRENPDYLRRRSFHYRARERAAGLYKTRAVSDTPRQSGACAEHPWPHGAGRLVRASPRTMAGGPKGRAARGSARQA